LDIQAEAHAAGILTEYYDARGQHRHVPLEVLQRVIEALPKPRPETAAEPIILRTGSESTNLSLHLGVDTRWRLFDGTQCVAEGFDTVRAPELPLGVYRLDIADRDGVIRSSQPVLVVPATAFRGEFDRVWVLAVQLYSLRSERNWGIGDFTDLKRLVEISSVLGCAGIGLNPLHTLFDDQPADCSPYAPNTRLFLNPIYIDVEAVAEVDGVDRQTRAMIAREKEGEFIDYMVVSHCKLTALRRAYEKFKTGRTTARYAAFDQFRHQRGLLLKHFAAFETMRKHFKRPWWEWPAEFAKPGDERVTDARFGNAETGFVEYLQWIAHEQLQQCTDLAKAKGLKVGLYLDVAVGVRADGFDAWLEQDAISRKLSVGAPPDLLNTSGQDWGLAGFNGIGLAARGFEPYRAMIEASARYAGAIRLDHVMGLARLFLVPSGFTPKDGAYVTMPLDALLAMTALESRARRCIIIGEDLGTVPEGFREKLKEWGVWSYQVMLFEREHDGRFKSPDRFSANALVTFNTHDLASYAGWRSGHDLHVKRRIAIDPGENEGERQQSVAALAQTLAENQVQGADFAGAIEFLSRTPSRILSVSYDDIVGVVDQINVPGTVDSHPNWRRRVPISIEDFCARFQAANMGMALAQRNARA
jgi:4-alpha-glucanotransferase